MFKLKKIVSKENKKLIIRYIAVSILSYGFVFSGLIIMIDWLKTNKTHAFLIIYGINYVFLYFIQLKYLFRTNHNYYKLIRYISFIIFFYVLANLLYNAGLYLNIGYLTSTIITIIILMPFRIIISKLLVFKE